MTDFDDVIVGSGFGGAVSACRLAEAGQRVLVLERGRRWEPTSYPSVTGRDFVYDVGAPERRNGWLDLRWFDDMTVAVGAGVGGGSLVYANVSVPPPRATFARGWPEALTLEELTPYVATVGKMLGVATIPERQRTKRWRFVQRGAEALRQSERFESLPLAIRFREDYDPTLPDATDVKHSHEHTNEFGRRQGTCVHLGHCDIGCKVQAKNTLDLNYLAVAESHRAEIRPLHIVRRVEPNGTEWRIHFERIADGALRPGSVSAKRVILAAGSLGSTEILLKSRLPNVSRRLGYGWSANGDFLTPALCEEDADPTRGPTITACIDHTDGMVYGESIFIQDGGLPNLIASAASELYEWLPRGWRSRFQPLLSWADERTPLAKIMPWFAQGIDASDGRLYLARDWLGLGAQRLRLDWRIERSRRTIEAIVRAHEQLARATGGKPIVSPAWTVLRDLITPHPLGGCNMANDASGGVVDHAGRVFGHPGLAVVDGSIIPRAIGRNPSRTIAAVAERAVAQWRAD
jgi:cholesterol oxidase